MIRSWLKRRRERRERHDAAWAPFRTTGAGGLNQLQLDFEAALTERFGSGAVIEREIEDDCDGRKVLWLTIKPQDVEIGVSDGLIQVGGDGFYEEWDGSPAEIIERACEDVAARIRRGT